MEEESHLLRRNSCVLSCSQSIAVVNMDETQPLLGPVDEQPRHPTFSQSLVEFDPTGDQDNPLDWPQAYKQGAVALLAFMAFTV